MNPVSKNLKQLLVWIAALFLLIVLFQNLKQVTVETDVPYSAFKARLKAGEVG